MTDHDRYIHFTSSPVNLTLEATMHPTHNPFEEFFRAFSAQQATIKPIQWISQEEIDKRRREAQFAELDIQNGDTVALRGKTSTLQGVVTQVRNVGSDQRPEFQVRIAEFDETPHGSHNTWFSIHRYQRVQLLNRAYRWTPEDRLIVVLLGISEQIWKDLTDDQRQDYRQRFTKKVAQIKSVLQP